LDIVICLGFGIWALELGASIACNHKNKIDLDWDILPISKAMRLLGEIIIIAAVIFLGWNKPFKEQVAQASTTIESKLHGTGSKLQKNQDPSVKRY
jgi:hypothetical protein